MTFPQPSQDLLADAERGKTPRERLYGAVELRDAGWTVDVADSRFHGASGWVRRRFGWLTNPIDLQTFLRLRHYDALVVKDNFSVWALAAGLFWRKPVVFMDSMFFLPRRFWRRWSAVLCVRLARATISFSSAQRDEWITQLGLSPDKVLAVPFPIDADFYHAPDDVADDAGHPGSVIAVGRDLGRDFQTLVDALDHSPYRLELVTLSYLSDDLSLGTVDIRLSSYLSYPDLFGLYRRSFSAVIPLRSGTTYASGIRAILEAMVLGVPVIVTRTPVVEEHFTDGEHLLMCEPDDPTDLREKIDRLGNDESLRLALARSARSLVASEFRVEDLAGTLASVISR